jgi:transglutaminase-like putative cysteine protease
MGFRIRLRILTSIAFLVCAVTAVHAQPAEPGFKTSITTTYAIRPNARAYVEQKITLTNLSAEVFATEYALQIGSNRLSSIKAYYKNGESIPVTTTDTENTIAIKLKLTRPAIGKDKSQTFMVSYENPDIAIQKGKILEVNLPPTNINGADVYQTTLIVPKIFGSPNVIYPKPDDEKLTDETTTLLYTDESKAKEAVSVVFGDNQLYNFNLIYHLENTTSTKGIAEIALIPDTPYQRVFYDQLEPQPASLDYDADGNWLAHYYLDPKAQQEVHTSGQVQLYLKPTINIPSSSDNLQSYVKPKEFWPSTDNEVKEIANKYQTPEAIYDYIVTNFNYNYQRLSQQPTRLGGKQALKKPDDTLCQEFTDAFIALARANGIPSREITGFAYTENPKLRPLSLIQDVLHSWPQYYDPPSKQWISIDPTWANTTGGFDYFHTFDLNHITFAIHGQDPVKPFPAGYYKLQETNSQDVSITYSDQPKNPIYNFRLQLKLTPLALFGLPISGTLTVYNLGNSALYQQPVTISTNNYHLISPSTVNINTLLPFSSTDLTLKLKAQTFFQSQQATINLSYQGQNYTYEIPVFPGIIGPSFYVVIVALAIGAAIIALFTRSLLVSRRR